MLRPLPPLNALRAFEVAARHNSFTGAAAELNVSHAAISRHVRALEARLGVTLFRKASRGVELTPDGARYLQAISTAFDTIAEATGALASPAPTRVRVSVHPAFAARWLIQRLGRFREAHPDCAVVLDATPRVVALEREEADIAIRNGDTSRPGLTRDLLARSRLYPVGARSLLGARATARRGGLAAGDLTQLVLLHDEDDGGLWRRWFAAAGIAHADVSRGLHILESGLAIDAAIAGQGIALADEFLIADDLAQGRLMKMCDVALSADDCDYHVVSLATAHRQRPVAAFREWLLRESESLRPAG